jgi:hypothetical protein
MEEAWLSRKTTSLPPDGAARGAGDHSLAVSGITDKSATIGWITDTSSDSMARTAQQPTYEQIGVGQSAATAL